MRLGRNQSAKNSGTQKFYPNHFESVLTDFLMDGSLYNFSRELWTIDSHDGPGKEETCEGEKKVKIPEVVWNLFMHGRHKSVLDIVNRTARGSFPKILKTPIIHLKRSIDTKRLKDSKKKKKE